MKKKGISPLIEKYSEIYSKDPKSRVFAPLAEAYRQAGLLDKAQEILKVGIRKNPTYLQGYITLANCYYDLGEYPLSYSTLRPLVSGNRDNIRLQKLFGLVCRELNNNDEALESYKYLLFLNPRDKEIATIVDRLEKLDETENTVIETNEYNAEFFDIDNIKVSPELVKANLDEWIKVDLEREEVKIEVDEKDTDSWSFVNQARLRPINLDENNYEKIVQIKENIQDEPNQKSPVITHSLVDLYIGQGHLSKAKELLTKILELNPNEESSKLKLKELEALEGNARLEGEGEDEGHKRLLDSLDEILGKASGNETLAVVKLQEFLDAIQKYSKERENPNI